MLADIAAKKEREAKVEEEKRMKLEKKLAKAREQCQKNYTEIPEKVLEETPPVVEKKKIPRPAPTDKNCLQAPDDEASPAKKKPFIAPDLEGFMKRNMPAIKVFANITDMKTWKKKN